MLIGLEFHTELFVIDAQISISTTRHGFRLDYLNFLGDHADINFLAPVIGKTVDANVVGETPEKHNVVLQHEIGPPAATATTAATAATAAASAASTDATATTAPTAAANSVIASASMAPLRLCFRRFS
jgi:hypothetical protein